MLSTLCLVSRPHTAPKTASAGPRPPAADDSGVWRAEPCGSALCSKLTPGPGAARFTTSGDTTHVPTVCLGGWWVGEVMVVDGRSDGGGGRSDGGGWESDGGGWESDGGGWE